MQKYDHVNRSKGAILFNNFLGGIAWGMGATIGASLFIALLGLIASQLNFVPMIGSFVSEVTTYVEERNAGFGR